MSESMVSVMIRLPESVIQKLDEICGGPRRSLGRSGGRAGWCSSVVLEKLGVEISKAEPKVEDPPEPKTEKSKRTRKARGVSTPPSDDLGSLLDQF